MHLSTRETEESWIETRKDARAGSLGKSPLVITIEEGDAVQRIGRFSYPVGTLHPRQVHRLAQIAPFYDDERTTFLLVPIVTQQFDVSLRALLTALLLPISCVFSSHVFTLPQRLYTKKNQVGLVRGELYKEESHRLHCGWSRRISTRSSHLQRLQVLPALLEEKETVFSLREDLGYRFFPSVWNKHRASLPQPKKELRPLPETGKSPVRQSRERSVLHDGRPAQLPQMGETP